MQALSVAISPAGINFLANRILGSDLVSYTTKIQPPDRTIRPPNFVHYENIVIQLSNAKLRDFKPRFDKADQKPGGTFAMNLASENFYVDYKWNESYKYESCWQDDVGFVWCDWRDQSASFDYAPLIGRLDVTVNVALKFTGGAWRFEVVGSTAAPSKISANVPARSAVQRESQGCFDFHVRDSTAESLSSVNFGALVQSIFPPLLKSIESSGHLTNDIVFEFAVGDGGLTFPGNAGIVVGVTGKVTYKGEAYPAPPPPPVPLPPPPTTDHHALLYVTGYQVDALYWAYQKAGLLNLTIRPSDLPDPDNLKVKQYVTMIPALKPYAACAMTAHVSPRKTSTTVFQEVYEFNTANMKRLQEKLPTDVFPKLAAVDGNAYVNVSMLETDLADAGVDKKFNQDIETVTRRTGMAVTQDIGLKLVIEDGKDKPSIDFEIARTDILTRLGLGVAGQAQTLTFEFMKVGYQVKSASTTVPKLNPNDLKTFIWPVIGETRYDQTLQDMGKVGVPLPIMSGFRFHFEGAQVTVQKGYVSILSKIVLKT